jgi:hypothetical protein
MHWQNLVCASMKHEICPNIILQVLISKEWDVLGLESYVINPNLSSLDYIFKKNLKSKCLNTVMLDSLLIPDLKFH